MTSSRRIVNGAKPLPGAIDLVVESGAEFSPCRRYRYRLWRTWERSLSTCAFIGLNPSTADETRDDPTIRKCVGFARKWGFGGCEVINLFGWCSTETLGLLRECGPSGHARQNARIIAAVIARTPRVVLAWGSHPRIRSLLAPREQDVRRRVESAAAKMRARGRRIEVGTLGSNADGSPRHPLYLPYSTEFM
jgi:hypothetical protein